MVEQTQGGIMAILGSMGVNGKLLLGQLVNVGIIILVMWRWVYRPLLKALNDRAKKIEQGLNDAAAAAEARRTAEETGSNTIVEARLKAKEIMDEVMVAAERARELTVTKAKEEVKATVEQAKAQIRSEKVQMMEEVQAAAGSVLALALERIVREKLDPEKDAKLIRESLKQAAERL